MNIKKLLCIISSITIAFSTTYLIFAENNDKKQDNKQQKIENKINKTEQKLDKSTIKNPIEKIQRKFEQLRNQKQSDLLNREFNLLKSEMKDLQLLLNQLLLKKSTDNTDSEYKQEFNNKLKDFRKEIVRQKRQNNDNSISVFLNGEDLQFDVKPIIINGRTYLPIRKVAETLGAQVTWDPATKTATLSKLVNNSKTEVKITIASDTILVNGQSVKNDAPAMIINGRTLVPIRPIATAFNLTIDWDKDTDSVLIEDLTVTPTPEPTEESTVEPILTLTPAPTAQPTLTPTSAATLTPTVVPTETTSSESTVNSTITPTVKPTETSTLTTTIAPTETPTLTPTVTPIETPTNTPTLTPTVTPIETPTVTPTSTPTAIPTAE